ncbi:hypothetical protein P5705_21490 [Pseudomonas entomophila]|uniref:hypothetical protein n=1 Tax=Pseudomonas entomophila TaxID=312306 RepID=UPI002404947A|nr:hypothetical protein [Pseudomonas entomophila]MDF9620230.1 hypothetical protein [Pseudomonas entomophila]
MLELKALLGAVVGPVYLGVLLASLVLLTFRPVHAASLFIWGCSLPLTAFSYLVWIHGSGGDHWTLPMLFIQLLALAQLGWLGGLCDVVWRMGRWLAWKRAGLVVSMVSVVGHGVFLGGIMMFGYGSS